jgi:MFS family permease
MSHEMTTVILPMFLASLGSSAAVLGFIEGVADAASSFIKLWMGWYSDRVGRRKPIMVVGYILTALKGTFALATAWHHVLFIRVFAWMGRGARGPVRDALLADVVSPEYYGRAFGFHSAMDTVGAIIGPAIALSLIGWLTCRQIFLVSFIPGMLAVACVVFLVRDRVRHPNHAHQFRASLTVLPSPYKIFLLSVGVFGLGNFAHTLLILRAIEVLTPLRGAESAAFTAALLYTLHNIVYAALAYPVGYLSERFGKRQLLGLGYLLFILMCVGFAVGHTGFGALAALFCLAGLYMALIDSMERALAADLLPEELRGTGYGVLATVNGVGDFVSSFVVGLLWSGIAPAAGFGYAAVLCFIGLILLTRVRVHASATVS